MRVKPVLRSSQRRSSFRAGCRPWTAALTITWRCAHTRHVTADDEITERTVSDGGGGRLAKKQRRDVRPRGMASDRGLVISDVPFIVDGRTGRRVTRWWVSYILVLVVFILAIPGTVSVLLTQSWSVGIGTPEAQLQEAITFGAGLIGLFLWVLLYERRSIASLGFRHPGRGVLTLLAAVIVGILLNAIPTLLVWAVGAYRLADPPVASTAGLSAFPALVLVLVFVLVQSGTEETLTRGFMLQSSAAALPGWLAIALPALAFTLFHGVSNKPLAFSSILLFALLVTFIVLRQGGLWIAIGIHTGWNFAMGNLFGISVSGLPPNTTSAIFLARNPDAPTWLTGGEFGTEASFPADVLLLVVAGAAYLVFRRWNTKRTAGA